jgi:ABC-2 type transport system ATP-binding protein
VEDKVLLEVKGAHGVLPAVVQLADDNGHTVTDLSINEPTLETVFIKLTGKDLRE